MTGDVAMGVRTIAQLPNEPAVYAMYGGATNARYPAYVGVGDKLRQRITQHLINRDSSVTARTSAVWLDPDDVTEVRWWEHPSFATRSWPPNWSPSRSSTPQWIQ